jgi:hypothetical protein
VIFFLFFPNSGFREKSWPFVCFLRLQNFSCYLVFYLRCSLLLLCCSFDIFLLFCWVCCSSVVWPLSFSFAVPCLFVPCLFASHILFTSCKS